jgi:hypothetical protein
MINIDNKWVKACQTSIPSVKKGEMLAVTLRELKPEEKKAVFFSPKSLADGFFNNAAGVVGFASTAAKVDESFEQRMAREKQLAEKLAAVKAAKKSS